jgi:RNA polymerase sigma-70 factor, ECF subfamily
VSDLPSGFDAACAQVRPDLHRFCSRMMGNPWDGEDVLQDTLVAGYQRAGELRDASALRSWLFRIAHNKCIDALRGARRLVPRDDDDHDREDPGTSPDTALDTSARAARTLAHIVTRLPPRERACVVLKDALDYSLDETAAITGSTIGAVKAALHRAREKLAATDDTPATTMDPARRVLVERYLALFNGRDWDGVRALLADDARLEVVQRAAGPFADACYFVNHERVTWTWRLAIASVDGNETIVRYRDGAPHSIVLLTWHDDRVTLVRDYMHVDGLFADATVM